MTATLQGDPVRAAARPGANHDARGAMLAANVRQEDYYESRFEAKEAGRLAGERAANRATNAWTATRRRLQALRKRAGVADYVHDLHRAWLGDLGRARVLDLGCFDGNALSEWIASNAAEYHGIDLSASAASRLDARLRQLELPNARAYRQDFLANSWPDGYFDVAYAYSVLHHFAAFDVALDELRRIVRPGGIVVMLDPLRTAPFNRLGRALYRPVQSDRDWEFPFARAELREIGRRFHFADVRGIGGLVKLSYPFFLVPALEPVGERIARWGLRFDDGRTRGFGLPLYLSWHFTARLVRRD